MSDPANDVVTATLKRELAQLQNIVGLCAFAVEARRIHSEIAWAANVDAALSGRLSQLVEAHNNWDEMPDTVAHVLVDVCGRLVELDALMCSQPAATD